MTRLLPVFVTLCTGLLVVGPSAQAMTDPMAPGFDDGFGTPVDAGPPSWFVGFFLLAVIVGVGTTIYRVSLAREMARDSGMDEDQATAMTLLSDNGLDATYLASSLREGSRQQADASDAPRGRSVNDRLRELQQLRDEGLVTYDEYEIRRKEILDSL